MTPALLAPVLAPVLASAPDETLEEGGSAGYIALLIVVLIGIALYFLIRNMNGRLRRLPSSFDETPPRERPQDDRPATG